MLKLYTSVPLLAASLVAAQFVAEPTDLTTKEGYAGINVRYKQVPEGICELDPNVKSYSGYADVGKDQHVFWWFFEARNQDPSEAPLTVWVRLPNSQSSETFLRYAPDQWRPWKLVHDWTFPRVGPLRCWTRSQAVQQPLLLVKCQQHAFHR